MESRGMNGGVVFDKAGSEKGGDDKPAGSEVARDGFGDEINKAAPIYESQSEESADLDAGAEGGASEEGSLEDGGEDKGEDPEIISNGNGVDPVVQELRAIRESLKPPPQPKRERTDEEWRAIEDKTGLTRTAYLALESHANESFQRLANYVDERLGHISVGAELEGMAAEKGFEDAPRYQKEVRQFIKSIGWEGAPTKEILKAGVVYSRGLRSKDDVKRAQNGAARNREIIGRLKPPMGKGPSGGSGTKLTPVQRSTARTFGMSDEAYSKLLKPTRSGSGKAVFDK